MLYNFNAEETFDTDMIYDYAHEQNVRVMFVRLMKKNERHNYQDTYTVQVNLDFDDYEQYVSKCRDFWPPGIRVRDYMPKTRSHVDDSSYNPNNY